MAESNSEERTHSSSPAATPQTDFPIRDLIFDSKRADILAHDLCAECMHRCLRKKRYMRYCKNRQCYCDYSRYVRPYRPCVSSPSIK